MNKSDIKNLLLNSDKVDVIYRLLDNAEDGEVISVTSSEVSPDEHPGSRRITILLRAISFSSIESATTMPAAKGLIFTTYAGVRISYLRISFFR